MTELKSPFRYDYVGSFLRPAAVKEARAKFAKNEITKEQLTEVENEEIKKLVEKQKAAGFHGLTDGEFRRRYWHLDFMWGFVRHFFKCRLFSQFSQNFIQNYGQSLHF